MGGRTRLGHEGEPHGLAGLSGIGLIPRQIKQPPLGGLDYIIAILPLDTGSKVSSLAVHLFCHAHLAGYPGHTHTFTVPLYHGLYSRNYQLVLLGNFFRPAQSRVRALSSTLHTGGSDRMKAR